MFLTFYFFYPPASIGFNFCNLFNCFRYFMINKDNTRTFRLIQRNFQLNLDEQFYMGKMNLLHIACDSGWANLAR